MNYTSSLVSNRPSSYEKRTYLQKTASVNKRLRIGDISRVAKETGYSTTHVSDVLAGKYFNEKLINAAFDMTRGRIKTSEKLAKLSN